MKYLIFIKIPQTANNGKNYKLFEVHVWHIFNNIVSSSKPLSEALSSIKTSIVLILPLCKEPNSTSTKTSSENHMHLKLQFSSAHLSQLIYDLWKLCDWLFACEQWALIDGPIIYHAAIDLGIVDRFGTLGIAGLLNAFYFERSLKWRSEIEFW